MDIFNREATDSEKVFLKNRIRAIFGSTEMLVHGIIKALLALLFILGGFSLHIKIMGALFFAVSSGSTFLMFSKMLGERNYSPIGAKMYSIFTLAEDLIIKFYLLGYCLFVIFSMFKTSLLGAHSEYHAVVIYKMGFWCVVPIIASLMIFSNISRYLKLQRKFAENIYDCVDAELVFHSTESNYALRSYIYALLVLVYNVFKMLCPSWYKLNILPAKMVNYLDSGIIIEKYTAFTFIALLLLSSHLVLSGRLAMKYRAVVKKLEKRVNENHAS